MKSKFISVILLIHLIIQIKSLNLNLDSEKIRSDILSNHNYHRKRHQVDKLVRKASIEKVAQDHSKYLASIERMMHSDNDKYGENLFFCYESNRICVTGESLV